MVIAEVSRVTPATQQTQQSARDTAARGAASVALVPVGAAPRRLAPVGQGLTRPDPSFVTQLIATAEMSPQTRLLRRAAPQDAHAAYRSVAHQNQQLTPPGVRMRQTA